MSSPKSVPVALLAALAACAICASLTRSARPLTPAARGPGFLAMLWGLYRLRLHHIRREFNAKLDGCVNERLRVERELHDTLVQSFQASLKALATCLPPARVRPSRASAQPLPRPRGRSPRGAVRSRICAPSPPADAISRNCSRRRPGNRALLPGSATGPLGYCVCAHGGLIGGLEAGDS
jgi:hypothetical protein